jgi:hypothetical protein
MAETARVDTIGSREISHQGLEALSTIMVTWGKLELGTQRELFVPLVSDMLHNMCKGVSEEKAIAIGEALLCLTEEGAQMLSLASAEGRKLGPVLLRPEDEF